MRWAPDPPGEDGWRFFTGGILVLTLLTMLWTVLCGSALDLSRAAR